MLVRTFNYTDFNGQKRSDTWYFNLSRAELLKMELGAWGGLDAMLKRLMREENPEKIMDMFEKVILSAVGEKSPDGRKFVKNDTIREDFKATQAYSDLFFELVTDPAKANAFLKGCVDEELAAAITANEKAQAEAEAKVLELPKADDAQ